MSWAELLEEKSALAVAVDLVGDRWSLMLLAGCFSGVCRFNQFETYLGINRNVLSQRLDRLVDAGLLVRHQYNDKPKRYEYQLTDIAHELRPVFIGLSSWAERHFSKSDTPFTISHKKCDYSVDVRVYCANCDTHVVSDEIYTRINPKASETAIRLLKSMTNADSKKK